LQRFENKNLRDCVRRLGVVSVHFDGLAACDQGWPEMVVALGLLVGDTAVRLAGMA